MDKSYDNNLVNYIKQNGPVKLKDGGNLNIALNLIEAFTGEVSCAGCFFEGEHIGCSDRLKQLLVEEINLQFMGCLNSQIIFVRVEGETPDNTEAATHDPR